MKPVEHLSLEVRMGFIAGSLVNLLSENNHFCQENWGDGQGKVMTAVFVIRRVVCVCACVCVSGILA